MWSRRCAALAQLALSGLNWDGLGCDWRTLVPFTCGTKLVACWGGMANISDWKKGSKWHVAEDNDACVLGKVTESTLITAD